MLTIEQQIFEQIKKAKNILITFKKTWDGDAVASALAIYMFLKKIGKDADIVAEKFDQNELFSFLPDYKEIKNSLDNLRQFIISLDITNTKVDQIKYRVEDNTLNFIISPKDGFFNHDDISSHSSGFKYDLIVTVDAPDLESLGKIYDNDTEFFYKVPIINIDHHPANEDFGQINLVELTAISTSEILFSIFENYSREIIDENIATCLLAGMISKTNSFKTQNVSPKALSIAGQLISMGAKREEIVNRLYRSHSLNILNLWGRVLTRLTSAMENNLVWSTLINDDFVKTKTNENDLMEIINDLIVSIPQVKVVVIIYEKIINEKISTQALIYSTKNINSLNLVKEFKPQGAKSMAKIILNKHYKEAEKEIITSIKKNLRQLPL